MRAQNTGGSRTTSRRTPAVITAIAVPLVIGVGAVLVPMTANAAVDLPDLTPAELVEFAASSDVDALTGTIEQSSELGLPELSGMGGAMGGGEAQGGGGSSGGEAQGGAAASATDLDDLLSLATGTHTANVYLDGDNARLQVLDRLAERNVYVSPEGVWVYDSSERAATHITADRAALEALKGELGAAGQAQEMQAGELPTPEGLLNQALERLDESTDVSVGTDAIVAGRAAYELVLAPRDADTLVGEVRVAVDAETGTALAASVTARGADSPAFSIAFTKVSFEAPDASVFAFTPPEGTAVTEHAVPVPTAAEVQQWLAGHQAGAAGDVARPLVHGAGWSAVVEVPLASAGPGSAGPGSAGLGAEASALLDSLAENVEGGRLLSTSLVSVLITDDGRVLAGSVSPERLLAVASGER